MKHPTTSIITAPMCSRHDPGPTHPESVERLQVIQAALNPMPHGAQWVSARRPATQAELLRVHTETYVTQLLALRGTFAALDHETPLSPDSVDAALWAAGAGIELVDMLIAGTARNGMAIVRPPGHHADRQGGMGFCLINTMALAAEHAHQQGIQRILVVDWDVHHGNGTYDIFSTSDKVLFIDLHQEGLYPGTGSVKERGVGRGYHYTLNIPLPPEADILDYGYALEHIVGPAARWYRPELVLVSCGFDAHAGDPTAGMNLTAEDFGWMTGFVRRVAEEFAEGRLGLILEGGYRLSTLGDCVRSCVEALVDTGGPLPLLYPAVRDRTVVEQLSKQLQSLFAERSSDAL